MRIVILILVLFVISIGLNATRKALVIGNASYEPYPLKNPINDATELAKALIKHDFQVTLATDLNKQGFYDAIGSFAQNLVQSDEVLFFFSGHGVQIDGNNYLMPVAEEINSTARALYLGYDCSMLLKELEVASVSIVILDACRNNPFSFYKSLSKGLASVQTSPGTQYIVHSTGSGKTADDGDSMHSPFTESLLANIDKPLKITDLIQVVTDEVARKTGDNQIPWSSGNLRRNFYITKPIALSDSDQANSQSPIPSVNTKWHTGSLKVESSQTGDLYLDNKLFGKVHPNTEVIIDSLFVGEHLVRVTSGNQEITKRVIIMKDEQESSYFLFDTGSSSFLDSNIDTHTNTPSDSKKTQQFESVPFDEPPQVIGAISPVYPLSDIKARKQGTVVLEVEISRSGSIRDIRVKKSVSSSLDKAAIEAVRKVKFKPGKSSGQPVDVLILIPIDFRL